MLLTEFHSSMLAGHFGAKKIFSLLSEHVWWPNMLGSCKRAYSCLLYLLKAKGQYIGYPWVTVALASTFWVVLILEHRFYYLLTIVFQL